MSKSSYPERFVKCLHFVLEREGGYVNDPADRGGSTNKGVTQKALDGFNLRLQRPIKDVRDITNDELEDFYFTGYWRAAKCNVLPSPLDLMVFDTAVNSGVGRAVKMLQHSLELRADGDFGPKSVEALQLVIAGDRVDGLARSLLIQRRAFYQAIVANDATQIRFLKGWLNRLTHLEQESSSGTRLA